MRPDRAALVEAMSVVSKYVTKTPLLSSKLLTEKIGCQELHFKAENLQKVFSDEL